MARPRIATRVESQSPSSWSCRPPPAMPASVPLPDVSQVRNDFSTTTWGGGTRNLRRSDITT